MAGSCTLLPKAASSSVVFGEATDCQELQCNSLAASAFAQPLSHAEYMEREDFMSTQALTKNDAVRIWCLCRGDDQGQVLATCKTVRRELLVKDIHGSYSGTGYCIASVVTQTDHRGRGYASMLLQNLAHWLDGPGDALASMLYSNKEGFYERCGWSPVPSPAIVLPIILDKDYSLDTINGIQGNVKYLRAEDINELCKKDIEALTVEINEAENIEERSILTVLPTSDLIGWQHARADFIGSKLHGKSPSNKGVIYDLNAWIYWHHDFRKQCLFIQRVRTFVHPEIDRPRILATLLLHALHEAKAWDLPKVLLWETGPDISNAIEVLKSRVEWLVPVIQARRRETISVRWRGDETKITTITPNEYYAWN